MALSPSAHKRQVSWKLASLSDKLVLLKLMERYYAFEQINFDLSKGSSALESLLNNGCFGEVFLILLNDDIAGYVVLTNGFSLEYGGVYQYIDELFISEGFRGHKLATATLNYIDERGARNNVTSMHLEVDIDNAIAQKLYRSQGYADCGRHLWSKRLIKG